MSATTLVVVLFLIPALILINEDFSWENFALKTVHSLGDRTGARDKLQELGKSSEIDYEDFRLRQLVITSVISFPLILILLFLGNSLVFLMLSLFLISFLVIVYCERSLSKRVKEYRIRIDADFPSVI
jgi:tight adherence protein C